MPGIFQVNAIADSFSSFRVQVFGRGLFPLHLLPGLREWQGRARSEGGKVELLPGWPPFTMTSPLQLRAPTPPVFIASNIGFGGSVLFPFEANTAESHGGQAPHPAPPAPLPPQF